MSPATGQITIREFAPGDEDAFRQLNEEWITRYFAIEAKDAETINHPQASILAPGGRIFFAVVEGRPVGCCALVSTGAGEFEVAKMAVTASCQGMGIGRQILTAVIEAARVSGARRLHLETNHTLTPAIRLYESIGFRHVPPGHDGPSAYVRADVFMEIML
ncbi:MAG TPA: GNAT family N-acetyltransferase [Bryobacteraceae bacterium]|jgi:GNAT superfamily N-acetyltransferase|nr:GNAT family N-acetyltransferase [Bryobacteraceae bacterium]